MHADRLDIPLHSHHSWHVQHQYTMAMHVHQLNTYAYGVHVCRLCMYISINTCTYGVHVCRFGVSDTIECMQA